MLLIYEFLYFANTLYTIKNALGYSEMVFRLFSMLVGSFISFVVHRWSPKDC